MALNFPDPLVTNPWNDGVTEWKHENGGWSPVTDLTLDEINATSVSGAGALMDSELTSIADIKALDQSVVSGASPTFNTANFTSTALTVTAVTFANSWVNYGAGHQTAGYYKDAQGIVHIQGLVKSGTVDTTIFTLPIGFRPTLFEIFVGLCNSSNTYSRINITSTGDVSTLSAPGNAFLSLAGVSFLAA
jgi:hypothetical protein